MYSYNYIGIDTEHNRVNVRLELLESILDIKNDMLLKFISSSTCPTFTH